MWGMLRAKSKVDWGCYQRNTTQKGLEEEKKAILFIKEYHYSALSLRALTVILAKRTGYKFAREGEGPKPLRARHGIRRFVRRRYLFEFSDDISATTTRAITVLVNAELCFFLCVCEGVLANKKERTISILQRDTTKEKSELSV